MNSDEIYSIKSNVTEKLTEETYLDWSSDMLLLLSTKGLDEYVFEQKVKIISKSSEEYKETCRKIVGTTDCFYNDGATVEDIKNDNKVKYFMKKIGLLEKTHKKGNEERKISYKQELEEMKFDKEGDIDLYLSNMENIFENLKDLGDEPSEESKYNYLYNSLPKSVIHETGLVAYQDNWENCKKCLIERYPRIKRLNKIREKQNKAKGE
ncbi:hypothetical protein PIROE2DRAFT_12077 [Piromyces sp. E2]|nr:hypothetical protein PIROE2DRAFT_12077 [Piromyces sp. E2]|eukprot:OUM61823.1 hypothetical protein PIROE2DRAFT_12077 [Piromyces sp. E2]